MSSGGRLSRKQKGKEVATASSPGRDASGVPLEEFEQVLVSESARSYRQEVGGTPAEPQVCERDGSGGARDGAPLVNYVPTCYYPGEIFEELSAVAPEFMRSPDVSGQAWENVIEMQSTPDSVKKLLRERRGLGVTFLIPSKSQRPWSPPVGFQCVYESYFQDDTKLWFPIPRLVTSYVRRRGAAISHFLNGSWRIAVALMVMAAEIDVSLSVCAFEELTSISSLDDGLLLIKMRPSYNVIGGTLIRHLTGRGLIFTSSATILPSRILRTKTTVCCGTPYLVEYPPDHPTCREYPEEFLSSARAVARLDQEHWGNISWERVRRCIDRCSRKDWNSSYLPTANKVKRRISLFTKEEHKRINEARKMRGLPDLSAMMATQLGLPSAEPSVPSNEMVVADTIDATLQRQDSSPGATAAASKKKNSKKRSRDDPSVGEDLETLPEETDHTEATEPPTKKRKKKKQSNTQQSLEENVATRGAGVAGSSARAGSTVGPTPNLALTDKPGNVSPEVPLQKKRSKQASEQGTTSSQVPSASAPSVARASAPSVPGASAPGTSTGGAPVVRKTLRVEFPDRVLFEYDGPTPLIYAPNRCAELVSQIKCSPKPLPPVADLIFQDEYVDAARTKLLCDGVSNFVIEKYDTMLKEALSESEKLKRTVAAKGRLLRRKRAEWQE
ncbi:meiosis-specific protein ASY2-like [Brassica napus]|uniref:meiosis-specific protein ASY2-like n=1 Tax=Brassica napus TaxID=3708 RepID=UPI002078AA37|nr:meiosis-specific protein ASY2-like [Brassica napus]